MHDSQPMGDAMPPEPRPVPVSVHATGTPPRPAAPQAKRSRGRDAAVVAAFALGTMAGVALLLRLAFGAADSRKGDGTALRSVASPPTDRCAVRLADGRVAGKVVGMMGRGGRVEAYRVEEWPGHGVAPVASTLDVPVGQARLEPCSSLDRAKAAK